jgi:predicted metal-binding membrane protein
MNEMQPSRYRHLDWHAAGILLTMIATSGAGWFWLAQGHFSATAHHGHAGHSSELLVNLDMWFAMTAAMMAPVVAPMLLQIARLRSQPSPQWAGWWGAAAFVAGYGTVWLGFALAAGIVEWQIEQGLGPALLTEGRASWARGALLVAAGCFQWTRIRRTCLERCDVRSARTDCRLAVDGGGFVRGSRYATYCLGCCWILMLSTMVGGLMSLPMMAALTVYMVLERTVLGQRASRLMGAVLVLCGGASATGLV